MGKPNIVLITIDSLRQDKVGCYGKDGGLGLTPNMDAFAKKGTMFTQAFSQGPYTTYSMPSIFTGRYPCRMRPIGVSRPWGSGRAGVMVEGTTTLAERLKALGYHTAGFHSNILLSRLFGFDKGFDVFFDDVIMSNSSVPGLFRMAGSWLRRIVRIEPFLGAVELNKRVLEWLPSAPEPFFLWIHYMDAHGPYLSKKVFRNITRDERVWKKSTKNPSEITPSERDLLVKNYHRQISLIDSEMGRVWEALDRKGVADRTATVVTADHGDEFFEHGGYMHQHKLYDELLNVPLLARVPGCASSTVDELAELVQITPTLVACAGGASVPDGECDGTSFLPWLQGQAPQPKPYIMAETGIPIHRGICVRSKEWKLISMTNPESEQLYHLAEDPLEKRNVIAEHSEVAARMREQIEAHKRGAQDTPSVAVTMTSEEQRMLEKRLEDLGYLE